MNISRPRPRHLRINRGPRKYVDFDQTSNVGNLSPDLQPNSPPDFHKNDNCDVLKIGKYLLVEKIEGNEVFKAVNIHTRVESICKVFPIKRYRELLSAYWQVDSHINVATVTEIILGESKAYVFLDQNYGDLHSYVRQKKRLKEEEACRLFKQIVSAVNHCHQNGIVLRDLKLRKFVFSDAEKTRIKLEGLEDAVVLEDESNDLLSDKHGCPAYVSPEILNANQSYSGKSADIWSLGVMLYTILIGRYPFHDSEPGALFGKIRRGQFTIPDTVSSKAKCIIKSLLRREPSERLTSGDILQHPWLRGRQATMFQSRVDQMKCKDQTVPDFSVSDTSEDFLL